MASHHIDGVDVAQFTHFIPSIGSDEMFLTLSISFVDVVSLDLNASMKSKFLLSCDITN